MSNTTSSKAALTNPVSGNHFVQVYQDSDTLVDAVCHFISDGLQSTEAVVVIAIPAHREAFKARLLALGIDIEEAAQRGQYRFFDAETLLSTFMVDGNLDVDKCNAGFEEIFSEIAKKHRTARIYGEMVDLLWQRGEKDKARELETRWNKLLKQYEFSLLCSYHVDNLDPAAYYGDIECLCSTHTHFLPSQDFTLLEQALAKASEDVMGVSLTGMLNSIGKFPHPTTIMPASQASLLYISRTMPVTTEFILKQVKRHLQDTQPTR